MTSSRAIFGVMVAVACCAAAWTAAPARAWRHTNTGSPGRVQVLRVYGFTNDAPQYPSCVFCDDVTDYVQNHDATFAAYTPQRYIWRAPFSGTQVATVQYRLFHKNYCSDVGNSLGTCDDGFKWFKTDTGRYTIAADAPGVWVPEWADGIDANLPDGVMFGMDIVVTWRSAAGAFLGQTYLDFNGRGDYQCLTKLCGIGSNAKYGAWIYLRS